MTLNRVMAVTLRYFTEFGKPLFRHITASICGGIYARVYCFVLLVRYRRKESSRSLSHLLMSFFVNSENVIITLKVHEINSSRIVDARHSA